MQPVCGRSTPLPPIVCRRAGAALNGRLRRQRARCGEEDVLERVLRGQQQPHPACVAHDGRADLQQHGPDRGGAGAFELRAVQRQAAQVDHQRVGQRRQQQPQLVGGEPVATGASAEQVLAFSLCASAFWALLPVIARDLLGLGAGGGQMPTRAGPARWACTRRYLLRPAFSANNSTGMATPRTELGRLWRGALTLFPKSDLVHASLGREMLVNEAVRRWLAVILAADAAGYSRLMGGPLALGCDNCT